MTEQQEIIREYPQYHYYVGHLISPESRIKQWVFEKFNINIKKDI